MSVGVGREGVSVGVGREGVLEGREHLVRSHLTLPTTTVPSC